METSEGVSFIPNSHNLIYIRMKIVMSWVGLADTHREVRKEKKTAAFNWESTVKEAKKAFLKILRPALKKWAQDVQAFRIKDSGGRPEITKRFEDVFQMRLRSIIYLDQTRDPKSPIPREGPDPVFKFMGKDFDVRDFVKVHPRNILFESMDDWFARTA